MKKIIAVLISASLLAAPFAFAAESVQVTDQTAVTQTTDAATPAKKKNCDCCKGKHKKHQKKAKKVDQSNADQAAPAADQPAAQ